jgi:hypothetical protein
MTNSQEWSAWRGAVKRCHCPTDKYFPRYGGRGISVCDEWRYNFLAFYAYLGPKPSPKHSLDRIDTNGNYEPGNVRWATDSEQINNRRISIRYLTSDGRMMSIKEAADEYGITYGALLQRLVKYDAPIDVIAKAPRNKHLLKRFKEGASSPVNLY